MKKQSSHKYLITGGYGFIGSALIRELITNNNNTIINIDKLGYASNKNAIGSVRGNKNYHFYKGDICNDKIISNALKKHSPDFIIHLAAETHVDRSIDDPSGFVVSNILGTYNLLNSSLAYWRTLRKKQREKFKLVLVSTDEVFGSLKLKDKKSTENSLYKPNSPYSASKASADHLGRAWFRTYKLPIITTNTCNNYGPWQFPEKLIPLTILKCIQNKKIPVYGNGKQIRDWIYVDDHIRGLLKVITKGKIGDTYNIGSNNELRNIDVVKSICSILDEVYPKKKGKYSELIQYVSDRPGHDTRYAIDNNKITKLGWKPKYFWKESLKRTVIWYINNQDFLMNDSAKNYSGERLGKI